MNSRSRNMNSAQTLTYFWYSRGRWVIRFTFHLQMNNIIMLLVQTFNYSQLAYKAVSQKTASLPAAAGTSPGSLGGFASFRPQHSPNVIRFAPKLWLEINFLLSGFFLYTLSSTAPSAWTVREALKLTLEFDVQKGSSLEYSLGAFKMAFSAKSVLSTLFFFFF